MRLHGFSARPTTRALIGRMSRGPTADLVFCFDSSSLRAVSHFWLAAPRSSTAITVHCRGATMAQAAQATAFDAHGSQIQVEHDKKRRQFVIRLNGSHDRAVLLYEYVGKKTVDLQHTEVPDAYRGRGIAKHLAKAAMDFVVEEDLKAHLTCWYIQKYVKENPQPQYFEHIYQ